jgi:hypothetical protein
MKYLLALALVLSATASLASLPPKRFDHPYKGHLTVKYLGKLAMWWQCYGSIACAYHDGPGRCTIYLPNFKTRDPAWMIRRHEIGHCNGWPAHHPR